MTFTVRQSSVLTFWNVWRNSISYMLPIDPSKPRVSLYKTAHFIFNTIVQLGVTIIGICLCHCTYASYILIAHLEIIQPVLTQSKICITDQLSYQVLCIVRHFYPIRFWRKDEAILKKKREHKHNHCFLSSLSSNKQTAFSRAKIGEHRYSCISSSLISKDSFSALQIPRLYVNTFLALQIRHCTLRYRVTSFSCSLLFLCNLYSNGWINKDMVMPFISNTFLRKCSAKHKYQTCRRMPQLVACKKWDHLHVHFISASEKKRKQAQAK